jgi:hypothetical protein
MNPGDEDTKPQEPEAQEPAPAPPVQPTTCGVPPPHATLVIPPVHGIPTQPLLHMPPAAHSIPLLQAPAPTAPPMDGMPPQPARPPGLPCQPVMPALPGSICLAELSRWNVIVRFLREARGYLATRLFMPLAFQGERTTRNDATKNSPPKTK